jgi:lysophospholipase L1-like esterase
MAGTNDAWFQKQRPKALAMCACQAFNTDKGTMTDRPVNDVLTLAESVRYGCELLRAAFPEAQIVLLTPLQSVAAGTENITKAGDIIECCARQLNINVIRLDKDGFIDAAKEKMKHHLTTDGTHTSELGARQIGSFVAQQISALQRP